MSGEPSIDRCILHSEHLTRLTDDVSSLRGTVQEIAVAQGTAVGVMDVVRDNVQALVDDKDTIKVPVTMAKSILRAVTVLLGIAILALGGYSSFKAWGISADSDHYDHDNAALEMGYDGSATVDVAVDTNP